jgi:hypothetical protein
VKGAAYVGELAQEVGERGKACVYLMNTPEHTVEGKVYPITMNASWMPVEVARFITRLLAPDVLSQGRKITINMEHAG